MLAEHYGLTNHQAMFDSLKILAKVYYYWETVILESIEISVDCTAVNGDVGVMLSLDAQLL